MDKVKEWICPNNLNELAKGFNIFQPKDLIR
jgi:hypothetical protein